MKAIETGTNFEKLFCAKHGIDFLPLSPQQRMQSVLIFRNDRRLNRRKCDFSGESMISAYCEDVPFPVIKSELWWGDGWDGLDYGIQSDSNLSVFDQIHLLRLKVPREGTSVMNAENCQFNSHVRHSRNCYLCHLGFECEDLMYCYWSVRNRDCIDCSYTSESTLCCQTSYATNCYQCAYLDECENCTDCHFSFQLRNCRNCILCSNLANADWHVLNRRVSKEEFQQAYSQIFDGTPESLASALTKFKQLQQSAPRRAIHSLMSENVSGEHILNSKNCWFCFDLLRGEDCFNMANGGGKNNIHGYSVGFPENEECYCSVTLRNCKTIFFSANCWNSSDLWYCDNCVNCSDCFGCVGLKNKKHCLFNVQLTPAAYQAAKHECIDRMRRSGEFGRFFPAGHSPFAYNESTAMDFFPLSREEITKNGYRYRDLTEVVDEAGGKQLESRPVVFQGGEIIRCANCRGRYRIVKKELSLYEQFGLPVPENCPDCRLQKRIDRRNPCMLISRNCSQCGREIETAYDEKAAPVIHCEECFVAGRS